MINERYKLNFGPGYRIYMGKEGPTMIIFLSGGSKKAKIKTLRYQENCGKPILKALGF